MKKVETYNIEYDREIFHTNLLNGCDLDVYLEFLVNENFYYVVESNEFSIIINYIWFDTFEETRQYIKVKYNIDIK